eukprot:4685790-Pleurochrysis_carterae.AAC.1
MDKQTGGADIKGHRCGQDIQRTKLRAGEYDHICGAHEMTGLMQHQKHGITPGESSCRMYNGVTEGKSLKRML